MKIKVYDLGCERCRETVALVRAVARESGVEVEIVASVTQMLAEGVHVAPAVAVNGLVKCTGRVPGEDEVRRWLQAARTTHA